jgi:hypothetical protein
MITLRGDLESIGEILRETFETAPYKRDYDVAFGRIARITKRYAIEDNPRNLRFRFILCMQEFFDAIPQDQWRVKDPLFVTESEDFAISKFKGWLIEQVT